MEKTKSGVALRIILSVLAAIALWLYVDIGQATTVKTRVKDIPVEFSGENGALADKGLMLLSGYDTTIDLVIEGSRSALWTLDKSAIRIVADTSSITETGIQSLSYQIIYPDNVSRTGLKVEASAYSVTVTVGELYTKEIPVYCETVGQVADGFLTEPVELDPAKLVLRGQREDLLNVESAQIELDIADATKTIVEGINYTLYDSKGLPVSDENIRTSTKMIQATLPVKTTKVVPLNLNFVELPGSTREQMECTIVPNVVTLTGEASALEGIEEIVLDTINLQNLPPYETLTYDIAVPEGTSLPEGIEKATVTIVIKGVSERNMSISSFNYVNVPEGCTAKAVTEGLNITMRGLTAEIDAMSTENLSVTADLSNITSTGNYTVPVNIQVNNYNNISPKGNYQIIVNVSQAAKKTETPTATPTEAPTEAPTETAEN